MAKNDLAYATVEDYRGILDAHWRPEIGNDSFDDVRYSRLAKIVDSKRLIKKETHNNIVSIVRCAFEYGYRFFTGLRPSEQIAFRVDYCDLSQGKIMVNDSEDLRLRRYREPYSERNSCVSRNLLLGKKLLWVAKQHGHSVQTMLVVYAAWIEGSKESDLEAVRHPMEASPRARAGAASGGGFNSGGSAALDGSEAAVHQPTEFGTGAAPKGGNSPDALEIVWWKGRDSNPRPRHYECRG